MDEAHKELVKRLRALRIMDEVGSDNPLGREAADALEALAGEVVAARKHGKLLNKMLGEAEAERDRLKAALVRVKQFTKGGPDHVSDDDITEIFKTADAALGDAS